MLHDADVCGVGQPACLEIALAVSWIGRHVLRGFASLAFGLGLKALSKNRRVFRGTKAWASPLLKETVPWAIQIAVVSDDLHLLKGN